MVNRDTSLQIEASTSTFACKDAGKECVFCLELPASHTYHRYNHDAPSFLSQETVSTRSAWECNLKRATLRCVRLPKSRCRYLGTEKGSPSTVTDLRGKASKQERKTTQAAKSSSHQLRKRGHLGRKAPSPEKKRGGQWGSGGLRADKPADLS